MSNRFLSISAGVISGWFVVFISDVVNHQFYPPPESLDLANKETVREIAASLPNQAFVYMIVGWAASVFIGGLVTGKIANENWKRRCLITGGILLLASVGNMLMIPHPLWVSVTVTVMYLPLAYLGGKVVNTSS